MPEWVVGVVATVVAGTILGCGGALANWWWKNRKRALLRALQAGRVAEDTKVFAEREITGVKTNYAGLLVKIDQQLGMATMERERQSEEIKGRLDSIDARVGEVRDTMIRLDEKVKQHDYEINDREGRLRSGRHSQDNWNQQALNRIHALELEVEAGKKKS